MRVGVLSILFYLVGLVFGVRPGFFPQKNPRQIFKKFFVNDE